MLFTLLICVLMCTDCTQVILTTCGLCCIVFAICSGSLALGAATMGMSGVAHMMAAQNQNQSQNVQWTA